MDPDLGSRSRGAQRRAGYAAARATSRNCRSVDLGGPVAYRTGRDPSDTAFVLVHGLGASHLSWVQVARGPLRAGACDRGRPARVRRLAPGGSRGRADGPASDALGRSRMGRRGPGRPLRELDGGSDVDPPGRGRALLRGRHRAHRTACSRGGSGPSRIRWCWPPSGSTRLPRLGEGVVSWRVRRDGPRSAGAA